MDDTNKPVLWKRNELGLVENIQYVYNPDGTINYRALIKPEFLVPNKQKTSETDVTKLTDKDLLILLAGLKEVAKIRGYSNVNHEVVHCSEFSVTVKTTITWIPNYETDGQPRIYSALADASFNNTTSFARNFLACIAENRGFVRAVRGFLGIYVVGADEVGGEDNSDTTEEASTDPRVTLQTLMDQAGVTFDNVKTKLVEESFPESQEFKSLNDIPKLKVFEIIGRLKKKLKKN